MFRFPFVLLSLLAPSFCIAQACPCDRVIPYGGKYRVDFLEKEDVKGTSIVDITIVDQFDDDLSGDLLLPGAEVIIIGDGNSADLFCFGNRYIGKVEDPPQALTAVATSSTPAQFGGLRMGEILEGPIVRPEAVKLIPKEPNAPILRFSLISEAGRASPAFCESIKDSIDSARIIQATYGDLDIVKKAEDAGVAASSPKYKAYPSLDDEISSYTASADKNTYQEMVRKIYKAELAKLKYKPKATNVPYGAAQGAKKFEPPEGKGIASTHPITCKITNPLPFNSDGTCRPEIELIAIRKHEEIHRNRCEQMNKDSILDDPYFKWSNHPGNLALDEIEAYQAALDVLEPWYFTHCDG